MSYADTANEVRSMWNSRDYHEIKHEDFIEPYELAYVKLKNQIFKFIESCDDISDKRLKKFIDKCHKIDIKLKISQLKKKSRYKV